jgi:hypothetical protein
MLLPIAAGGLGLHRTANTSPTAFFAAHVGVVRDDPESWNAIDTEYPNSSSDLMNVMTQCAIEIRKQCLAIPRTKPPDPDKCETTTLKQLDKVLIPVPPTGDITAPSFTSFYARSDENGDPQPRYVAEMNFLRSCPTLSIVPQDDRGSERSPEVYENYERGDSPTRTKPRLAWTRRSNMSIQKQQLCTIR